jgi:glutamate decarboxylase
LYYNLIKLGFDGYRKVSLRNAKNARLFARALENSKYFDVVSEVHHPAVEAGEGVKTESEPSLLDKAAQAVTGHSLHGHASALVDDIEFYKPSLPVVAFKFNDQFRQEYPTVKQRYIQTLLRSKSWIVPNYELPPNAENEQVLRVVIRENFSEELGRFQRAKARVISGSWTDASLLTRCTVERLIYDLIEVVETLMKEAKESVQQGAGGQTPTSDKTKNEARPHDGHERQATKHGEGVRPTGHDSVC